MNEQSLREVIEKAIESLFADQPNIFEFTPESGQTEWNLGYHFACELRKSFPKLDCDLDLRKPGAGDRRPDIVLHERGTHARNFLVVELKRDNEAGMIPDAEKIKTHWFAADLLYQFGAVLNLNHDHTYNVAILVNPEHPANAAKP